MTQRDWIEKDFYRELGVASGATQDEIERSGPDRAAPACAPRSAPPPRNGSPGCTAASTIADHDPHWAPSYTPPSRPERAAATTRPVPGGGRSAGADTFGA
jgi:molecular chaperone DnaJ